MSMFDLPALRARAGIIRARIERREAEMVACVHVARILPGRQAEFAQRVKEGMEANPEALRAFGFKRIVSFTTPEASPAGEALLVTVYEADDPSVIERFYALEAVQQQEAQAHGTLVAEHDHDAVPQNIAFLDLRLEG